MATITSKFDIDDVVFMKSHHGVVKGTVCAIGIDMSKVQSKGGRDFALIYLIWVSDRRDNAGHHERCHEGNLGRTFDEAYYDADEKFPWDVMEDVSMKDFKQFFKTRTPASGLRKEY